MNPRKSVSMAAAQAALTLMFWAIFSPAATAQQPAAPEAIPVPSPWVQPPLLPQPPARYDSLDAGRDAYLRAEAQRREAIARQLAGNAYAPSHAFPLGMYLRLGPVYAYLPPAGRRAYAAYAPPVVTAPPYGAPYSGYALRIGPWPGVRAALSAYVDRVPQPLGHVVTPSGPNGYVYRPYYKEDLQPQPPPGPPEAAIVGPPPAQPRTVPPPPIPQPPAAQPPLPQPPAVGPPQPAPAAGMVPPPALPVAIEAVPAPRPENGPREF
jgi:hypothetical protein